MRSVDRVAVYTRPLSNVRRRGELQRGVSVMGDSFMLIFASEDVGTGSA